jgi:glucose-6-phosphate dehydrogenase assembly protein OpcA
MMHDLTETTASAITTALTESRRRSGTAALGMVLTLVVVVDERDHYDAVRAATDASREHPCRILVLIRRPGRAGARLDAELRVGDDTGPGETILLRVYGPLGPHADSVVLPLLLPDAPVLAWWPGVGPTTPSEDQIGRLAQRRVTDTAAATRPLESLSLRREHHEPGDTDFAWTRTTPWRALLAAGLDLPHDPIVSGKVLAARGNPSAELLASWLETRLGIEVERATSRGPGITGVHLRCTRDEIAITRPDGRLATLIRPGEPERRVPLVRRSTTDLLAEEMRRLDPDEVFAETLANVFRGGPPPTTARAESSKQQP